MCQWSSNVATAEGKKAVAGVSRPLLVVCTSSAACHGVHHITKFTAEGVIFDEELIELGIVFQYELHHLAECFVVYHAGGVRGVFPGVPIGCAFGYFRRNVVNDAFGRFEHGVHAADDTHGENDVGVFAPLEEVTEDIVGYAPDKGYNFVMSDFVHEMLFSGSSEVNGIQGIREMCVKRNIGKRFELERFCY